MHVLVELVGEGEKVTLLSVQFIDQLPSQQRDGTFRHIEEAV